MYISLYFPVRLTPQGHRFQPEQEHSGKRVYIQMLPPQKKENQEKTQIWFYRIKKENIAVLSFLLY